jgi:hypothetical protein
MELSGECNDWDVDFNELRRKLNLPIREPIDPQQVDLVSLPMSRYAYLVVEKMLDEQLEQAYEAVRDVGSRKAVRRLAQEVVRRPSLETRIDTIEAHELLSNLAVEFEDALAHLSEARRLGVAQGDSPARWLVSELEIYLLQGDVAHAQRLLNEIQARYLQEPGIAQALMEVLSRLRWERPDRHPAAAELDSTDQRTLVEAGAAETAGRIWTPDQTSSAGAAERGKTSKLWVPGMD